VPQREIAGCVESHARLHSHLEELDEETVRRPSLLPGWTVAHVLAHVARNADSVVRRVTGAMNDQLLDQYVGGQAGRAADIDAGSRKSVDDLVHDVREADRAVDELFATLPAVIWDRPVSTGDGRQAPAAHLAFARWREIETHHVDLGLGYTQEDWPQDLVDRWLPQLVEGLVGRADHRDLMAWALGRASAPPLTAWG